LSIAVVVLIREGYISSGKFTHQSICLEWNQFAEFVISILTVPLADLFLQEVENFYSNFLQTCTFLWVVQILSHAYCILY